MTAYELEYSIVYAGDGLKSKKYENWSNYEALSCS
jgi:hypothetical protein